MAERNKNISIYFHVHLVSDSTGETLVAMMKASTAQFRNATALEHLHTLVRSEAQLNIPAISILDPTLSMLGRYLGSAMISEVGAQRNLDAEYYNRIEALDFAMAHDDGQNVQGLRNADIILLGISRTSKTPTCIYLANRGFKAGNIPLVPNAPLPTILDNFTMPYIIGLVASPDRIVQIREQRLMGLNQNDQTDYIDVDRVREEMREAKRMFVKKGYKVIDVTRKSIEETSAQIINAYQTREKNG